MKRILSLVGTVLVMGSLYWFGGGPPDGSIEEADLPDGPFEEYYDNGELMLKGTFKDGVPDGPLESYYPNGQLDTKGTLKDGVLDGPYERYYDNGQLGWKGSYKDGELCGEWFERGETVTYDPC